MARQIPPGVRNVVASDVQRLTLPKTGARLSMEGATHRGKVAPAFEYHKVAEADTTSWFCGRDVDREEQGRYDSVCAIEEGTTRCPLGRGRLNPATEMESITKWERGTARGVEGAMGTIAQENSDEKVPRSCSGVVTVCLKEA